MKFKNKSWYKLRFIPESPFIVYVLKETKTHLCDLVTISGERFILGSESGGLSFDKNDIDHQYELLPDEEIRQYLKNVDYEHIKYY